MISSSLDDSIITESEFSVIVEVYNSAMLKLEIENNDNNNVNNISDIATSTNSRKYHPCEKKHDIDNINKP